MPHPRYKGPREPVLLRMQKQDKELFRQRAQAAGLDYTEYVLTLMRRDEVDTEGRPSWAVAVETSSDELPLAM